MGNTELNTVAHKQTVREAGAEARKAHEEAEKESLEKQKASASLAVKKRLERIGQCGSWLTVTPSKLDGTLLSAEEYRDNIRLRYGLRPSKLKLADRCDGCGCGFSVGHALSCKVGGLVGQRHDDTRDEAGALCAMALTESRVSYEPMIFYGTGVNAGQRGDAEAAADSNGNLGDESRGDVSAHGLYKRGQSAVLDICVTVTDTDSNSYKQTLSEKVLEKAAKRKKQR